jgi:hypothetical protein
MERPAEPCAGSTPFARKSVSWQNSTSSTAHQCCLSAGSFRLEPVLRHHAIVMACDILLEGAWPSSKANSENTAIFLELVDEYWLPKRLA